jgi:hypothetical protein
MGMFGDDGQVADLRIAIDLAENPGFAADATIAPDASMRPVNLGYIRDPGCTMVVEVFLALNIPSKIATSDIGEIPERPDSIHRPLPRSQEVAF